MDIKEVREQIDNILIEGHALLIPAYTPGNIRDQILHIPISKGKVCPKCTGDGQRRIPVEGMGVAIEEGGCLNCNGTGKLPDRDIEYAIKKCQEG